MKKHFAPLLMASALVGSLSACGGASSTTPTMLPTLSPNSTPTPVATPTAPGATPTPGSLATPTPGPASAPTTTQFVISLNGGGGETILSMRRRPQFVSPSTQSITFAVDGGSTTTQNLSASATNCASSNGGVRCTVPLANVAAGAHTLALTTWSGTNGTGNQLGANSSIAFTVVAHAANTVSGIIGGIAAGINVVPISGAIGSMTQGITLVQGSNPSVLAANPIDASGNVIVGPGTPTTSVTVGIANVGVTPGPQNTYTFTVTPGYLSPTLRTLDYLNFSLTPVANSGGTPLSVLVGISGEQPRIYLLSDSGQVSAFDELGNAQTSPSATDVINSSNSSGAIAWNSTQNTLLTQNGSTIRSYDPDGDNMLSTLSQGSVTAADNVLAWDATDQSAFEYDTTGTQLAQIGPWPTPTTITKLGSSGTATLTALAWAQYDASDDFFWAATGSTVFQVFPSGAAGTPFTSPGIGTINGLCWDPASQKLFVAGSTGVTYYTGLNSLALNTSGGFSGVVTASSIACDPANGLVYVVKAGALQILAFNESGVLQFQFSTGGNIPTQIIAAQ